MTDKILMICFFYLSIYFHIVEKIHAYFKKKISRMKMGIKLLINNYNKITMYLLIYILLSERTCYRNVLYKNQ